MKKKKKVFTFPSDPRYNNMQVNPDGSLATNQTNESNHNTAKVGN